MSEFDLIARYFTRATPGAVLGVGDDAALFAVPEGMELAVSTDMLVAGTHFFPDADPYWLGHKVLAVNLSDLAAMGAQPRWATLSLSLPQVDEAWLQQFSSGFFALADRHGVELIGGDTTRGPLNLCVTIMGLVPKGAALRRSGAQVGDDVWVSGSLGDAALALAHVQGRVTLAGEDFAACAKRLHAPEPRVQLGLALRGVASGAIDISDGLLADLGHILECSGVGAELDFGALPVSEVMRFFKVSPGASPSQEERTVLRSLLAGGDDYELCFTASAARRSEVGKIAEQTGLPLARIGAIVAGKGCTVRDARGGVIDIGDTGYDHFR